jgi:tetratricopeptide (TPR) repeat protein
MSNATVERRLALFEGNNEIVSKRDDAFARQITVLTLAGKPDKAVEYLTGRKFNYREGSSRVRDIIIDAELMLGKKYFAEKDYNKALENFLLAQVPEEEAGESRSGNRNLQVDYFIGTAYEALGNKTKARNYFTMSTGQQARTTSYIKYYQALSCSRLGKKKEAEDIFNSLITEGDRQIAQSSSREVDFFAKFGEKEAENARLSNAYLLKGLGYKGLGNTVSAKENLQKAVDLSAGNLYANVELNNL